jgi:ankyrin repeat protein
MSFEKKYLKYKTKYLLQLNNTKLVGGAGVVNRNVPLHDLQNVDGTTFLMLAAKDGKEQLVDGLINSGANLNFQDNDGNTALMHAIKMHHINIAIKLINSGADLNIRNQLFKTAYDLALSVGLTDVSNHIRDIRDIQYGNRGR